MEDLHRKITNENIIESTLKLLPFITDEERAELLTFISTLFEKHYSEIENSDSEAYFTEPENAFTRVLSEAFLKVDDSIKPFFIADVMAVITQYRPFIIED